MYNPAVFREERPEVLYELIRQYPLGTLITSGPQGLEISHVPFVLDCGRRALRCHLARANPQSSALAAGTDVMVVFHGPSHYISPSWYPSKQEHGRVVPTWNYAVVHVRGRSRAMPSVSDLLIHLNELTAASEASFAVPWQVSDAPERFIAGLAETIIGIEIEISGIDGKFKLSQNRSPADRAGVIAGLDDLNSPASLTIADLMRRRTGS